MDKRQSLVMPMLAGHLKGLQIILPALRQILPFRQLGRGVCLIYNAELKEPCLLDWQYTVVVQIYLPCYHHLFTVSSFARLLRRCCHGYYISSTLNPSHFGLVPDRRGNKETAATAAGAAHRQYGANRKIILTLFPTLYSFSGIYRFG